MKVHHYSKHIFNMLPNYQSPNVVKSFQNMYFPNFGNFWQKKKRIYICNRIYVLYLYIFSFWRNFAENKTLITPMDDAFLMPKNQQTN
jgi:hypothetical protein